MGTMRRHEPLPDPLPKGPFRVSEALRLGVGRGRLKTGDLGKPYWGIRDPDSDPVTFERALEAATVLMTPEQAFSHDTAVRILGLPHPRLWTPHEGVHVIGPTPDSRIRRRGIVPHRGIERRSLTSVDGLPCVDGVTTWADLGGTFAVDDLIVLGDAVAHWRHGAPLSVLQGLVAARDADRGVRRLRVALPQVRTRSDSAMETRGRLMFVRGGLPEPELNVAVTDAEGGWLATGDYVWRKKKVVGEFDGDHHRTDRRQWQVDVARRESVQDNDWRYGQLTAAAVTEPRLIRRTLDRFARWLDIELPREEESRFSSPRGQVRRVRPPRHDRN